MILFRVTGLASWSSLTSPTDRPKVSNQGETCGPSECGVRRPALSTRAHEREFADRPAMRQDLSEWV